MAGSSGIASALPLSLSLALCTCRSTCSECAWDLLRRAARLMCRLGECRLGGTGAPAHPRAPPARHRGLLLLARPAPH
eukprot:6394890-Alexandrium_andersonii.AAC.1